jgi:uracil-DNA glycosylase
VVALGRLADHAFHTWKATPNGQQVQVAYRHITHPTAPESGAARHPERYDQAMAAMLANWNTALHQLKPAMQHPDADKPLVDYGDRLQPDDYAPIPARDLPAGLPAWMRSRAWADRRGRTADARRATIVVTVPTTTRPWPR